MFVVLWGVKNWGENWQIWHDRIFETVAQAEKAVGPALADTNYSYIIYKLVSIDEDGVDESHQSAEIAA